MLTIVQNKNEKIVRFAKKNSATMEKLEQTIYGNEI